MLQGLPKANNRLSEIKHNHEVTEKLLRQLEVQGEAVGDQRILVQQLLCKYPTNVIIKLKESKEPDILQKCVNIAKGNCSIYYSTRKCSSLYI